MRFRNFMRLLISTSWLRIGAIVLLLIFASDPRQVGIKANAQKSSPNAQQLKGLMGTWRSFGAGVNVGENFSGQPDYSGHYRAEIKRDELVLTWVWDKDTMYNIKGDERISFYLKFDGRKFSGRKDWDGWPKTWGHVNEDATEMWIYSSGDDNMITRLLKREP